MSNVSVFFPHVSDRYPCLSYAPAVVEELGRPQNPPFDKGLRALFPPCSPGLLPPPASLSDGHLSCACTRLFYTVRRLPSSALKYQFARHLFFFFFFFGFICILNLRAK